MDDATRLEVFRRSLLSRRLEERVMSLAKAGEVPASLHMGAGQEVAQIAALAALDPLDPMLYGHRGVGYWIARGVEPEVILCDIAYREGGTNRGKGGPMHLVDVSRGVLGETGSLGGNFVIGVGMAFAEQYRSTGHVAVVFFGDGTANRGQFHEALNFAGLRRLPIVFFCENNGWGLSTPTAAASAVVDIARRADGYDMPGVIVDGRDADAVYGATREAADRARTGGGATLVEAKVDRLHAHYLGDREPYRTADQKAVLWDHDPLSRLASQLEANSVDIAEIETEMLARVERAVEFMRAQPLIDVATVRDDVYSQPGAGR
jgi:acetoin:2,6-dichlorophenolindophenol oxidoreductase subunit alpha